MKTFTIICLLTLSSSFAMADCSSGNCSVSKTVRKSVTITKDVVSVPVNICRKVVTLPSRVRCYSRCR